MNDTEKDLSRLDTRNKGEDWVTGYSNPVMVAMLITEQSSYIVLREY